jgi:histidine triad (HIT) family protein
VPDCVFCGIIARDEYDSISRDGEVVAFAPLHPVVPGHMLAVPVRHVTDALASPLVTAAAFRYAAQIAQAPCNLMTSAGREATQTVFHLHVHIVPRREHDGLMLPWSEQQARAAAGA